MHDRRRYFVAGEDGEEGMVEIVDPVGNETFCANCHRVRLTHDGYLKGCLNRNDDLRAIGETKAQMREAFRATVASRVPYYGEYMVETEDGWEINEKYVDEEGDRVPYSYSND